MDAELDESSVDVQCEEKIVIQSRALLPAGSQGQIQSGVDDLDEILRPLGLHTRLVVLERDNSIAVYFICMVLAALMSLRNQWDNGQLKVIIESVFTFLSGAAQTVRVKRLTWPLTDFQRCLQFFNLEQGKPTIQSLII